MMFPIQIDFSGLRKSRRIANKFKPMVIDRGTGGFTSGPLLQISQNIPTVVQEQNSYPELPQIN